MPVNRQRDYRRGVHEVSQEDREKPLALRVDNTAACGLATTSPGSWKTRHLKVKARHLRMETSEGRIKVIHTPGDVQVADMGTKPVSCSTVDRATAFVGDVHSGGVQQ